MKPEKNRLIVSSILALTLASTLAGCSGNNGPAAGKGNNAGDSSSGTELKPVTLTYFSEDSSTNWNNMKDEVGKIITEKTGVTLDAEFAVGDPVQKISLIAATGNYPDLIAAKADVGKLVDAGAVIDLTELIDKHAPNIKKMLGDKLVRTKYSLEDQSIYSIPTWSAVDEKKFKADGGFELQHRVVKEAGYPEIKTVKDFEKVIQDYITKHPTDENGNKNVGLSLNGDDWHMYQVTNAGFQTTGGPDDGEYYIDQETHQATYHFRRPEEKEYFRWLNHMNNIGLLDPESFVQKTDQFKAKVASGRVLGLADPEWDYGDAQNALKAAGKVDQTYGHYPVTLSKEYKDTSFWPAGFDGGYGISISSKCKDPVRAIQFLDFLASEEGQILNNWGIEGKHYTVEGGKRVVIPAVQERMDNDNAAFQKEAGVGLYWNMMVHYGDGIKDSTGNYFTRSYPEQLTASYSEPEKETLKAYGAEHWKDLFPAEEEFEPRAYGAAYTMSLASDDPAVILGAKMKDITWKRIPEAVMSKPEEFDAIWDAYMADLDKAGVKEMEEAYTEHIQNRIELWSTK
ncbi:ABC transporter substrate-binding protein [Paenibacillus jilunlii]|uniref:ABC transporter substrate-binding protein n=1 Tax=Paenibacillus jilunlii TaxID=682956 RepID=A0A1G9UPW0_9BACL|nr:ABC transporter substrate-binding protein [Paenibacillus jilunlii]KWX72302.1 ABC transporter substrate-binding protein [Paenibacillus jilunlii]SDM61968.1 carbohydrate ABC transporter substrate-binding protein, CUT1 family [Paenibacillus jilunlii]